MLLVCFQTLLQAAESVCAERVGSSSESSTRSWVSSMSAVWSHLGVGSAKGPLGKEAKEQGWDVSEAGRGRLLGLCNAVVQSSM